jgi:hypothetical protein
MGNGMGSGMGNGMGNGKVNRNGNRNEVLTIILNYLCPKSYMYPVSATAMYTSPTNNLKNFTSQSQQLAAKILFFFSSL